MSSHSGSTTSAAGLLGTMLASCGTSGATCGTTAGETCGTAGATVSAFAAASSSLGFGADWWLLVLRTRNALGILTDSPQILIETVPSIKGHSFTVNSCDELFYQSIKPHSSWSQQRWLNTSNAMWWKVYSLFIVSMIDVCSARCRQLDWYTMCLCGMPYINRASTWSAGSSHFRYSHGTWQLWWLVVCFSTRSAPSNRRSL